MTTFLDTNVLIYILDPDGQFHDWAIEKLKECKTNGPAIISDIVYCEFSVGMPDRESVDATILELGLERFQGNDAALFRAAQAYRQYKDNNGTKTRILPDFIVGAIAEVAQAPLVTVNSDDFTKYFPDLVLISPS